jgi:riboflavin kinase/FMN adenylyltransferase
MSIVTADSATVSSTRIRELVTLGQMAEANALLLEPYRIEGEVVSGAERGRLIGFPTANLDSIPVLLPALGVYAGRVRGIGQLPLAAAIHIGPNPTFGEDQPKVEVHIANWRGALYGQKLQVEVLDRVREIRKFASVDELKRQLELDVQECVRLASVDP